jgi:hypothetical protein
MRSIEAPAIVTYAQSVAGQLKWGAIIRGADTGPQFTSYNQMGDYLRDGALPIVAWTVEQCK